MNNRSIEIMAKTMFGEARGEYRKHRLNSLIAVGNVIMNRCQKSGKSIEAECLRPKQFSCWNNNDPNYNVITQVSVDDPVYRICLDCASKIISHKIDDITKGSNHYYSKSMKEPPYWARDSDITVVIGNHIFLKL